MRSYSTVQDIIEANVLHGGHFFDQDTMSGFNSQLEPKVYHGCYFITSEAFVPSTYMKSRGMPDLPRRWTIRLCNQDGAITTVGQFQAYQSVEEAETALMAMDIKEVSDEQDEHQ